MSSKKSNNQSKEVDVQAKLREFYSITKEKLLKMKNELEEAEREYEAQKAVNEKIKLEYKETLCLIEPLDIRIKGIKEKIHAAEKTKAVLEIEIKEMNNEISAANNDINHMTASADLKVKNVQNQAKTVTLIKEQQVQVIQERIDKEIEKKQDLRAKIAGIEIRIKQLRGILEENHTIEGKHNDALLKDTVEMSKFLSEI